MFLLFDFEIELQKIEYRDIVATDKIKKKTLGLHILMRKIHYIVMRFRNP